MSASAVDARLLALRNAVGLARGRLDDAAVTAAAAVVDRAGERLGLGTDTTIVVLAGPTGAGKSTMFNALAGKELARPGHLRPTTSASSAAVFGDVPDALLDWLDVPRRHRVSGAADHMVLVDLPDFDSVEQAHRAELDRMVARADLTVWIVDPQKYADGVLHEQYLRPFAQYADNMIVVLNQADRLEPAALGELRTDLERLVEADGWRSPRVLAVSSLTGLGMDELRRELQSRVAARTSAAGRLGADVDGAVAGLDGAQCDTTPAGVSRGDRAALVHALAAAAGVPRVVDATGRAHRRSGGLATGWPPARWLRRFRPDPLRRLGLGTGAHREAAGIDVTPARSSVPAPTSVQLAQVEAAARTLAAAASAPLQHPWPSLVRLAALSNQDALPAALERAVASVDVRGRAPLWWRATSVLQRLLLVIALAGAVWLLVLAGLAYLQLDRVVSTPELERLPLPTVLLLGGLLAGVLVAVLAGAAIRFGAQRRARAAQRRLRVAVDAVVSELVVGPVEVELAARADLCRALADAADDGRTRRRRRTAAS